MSTPRGEGDDALTVPALRWGIKQSFIGYVSALPDGEISTFDGAEFVEGTSFVFAAGADSDFDPATGLGAVKFTGGARISGHSNQLRMIIADPWIELSADECLLSVLLTNARSDSQSRVPLAELTPRGTEPDAPWKPWGEFAAVVTDGGGAVFNEQYVAGDRLDPVGFVLGS